MRYDYPIAEVQEKIRAAHLPDYLADALESRTMSDIPFDDGNCFACGPENPIGMHLHFERADGRRRRAPRHARARSFKAGAASRTAGS